MGDPIYCYPSDILTDIATAFTWQTGTPIAAYPIAQGRDKRADTVTKVTGNGTIRATFSSAKTLQGIVLVHTNASAVQITNGAGLNVAMSIPATPLDGLWLDPWKDLRGVALTSSTQWDIALTGPGPTGVAEVLLVETWRTMPVQWGIKEIEIHGGVNAPTDYGTRQKFWRGTRQRGFAGHVMAEEYRAALVALKRDARGATRNFAFILDDAINDAVYVDLTTDQSEISRIAPAAMGWDFVLTEQQKGLAY